MLRLICAITGDVAWIPSAWTVWRIGSLVFRRQDGLIEWRESGSWRWRALPAIARVRERINPSNVRRSA